ncbi:MAG TPA: MFS transporter [Candidatus Limnocylindria bacterium]|nr:MFS transporter [Candidatus Limnocylindria bacterium]
MSSARERAPLASGTQLIVAVACAITVANNYYAQPLLAAIGRDLHAGAPALGAVAAATQFGYGLGILALVPLGDAVDPRRLVLTLLGAVTVALVVCALAPNVTLLAVASFALGFATVVPQILIPYIASLADAKTRGRVIGSTQSGMIIGILGARVISGALEPLLGWRTIFLVAAGATVGLAIAVALRLPGRASPVTTASYGELMRSLPGLLRAYPALREACLLGALSFIAFSAFWTTIALFLTAHPLRLAFVRDVPASAVVGALALVGIASALAAPAIGRLADRRGALVGNGIALALCGLGYLALLLADVPPLMLAMLLVGVVLLDIGSQGNQVSNQTRILALAKGAGSRVNTVYMTTRFLSGALGSVLAAWAWDTLGWSGVCALGLASIAGALIVYGLALRHDRAERARGA